MWFRFTVGLLPHQLLLLLGELLVGAPCRAEHTASALTVTIVVASLGLLEHMRDIPVRYGWIEIGLRIEAPLHIEVGYIIRQLARVNAALSDAIDVGILSVRIESVEGVCDAGVEVILTPLTVVEGNSGGVEDGCGSNRLRTIAAEGEHFG